MLYCLLYTQPQCVRNAVLYTVHSKRQSGRNAVLLYTQPQCVRNAVLLYTQPQCDRNVVLFYTLTQAKCGLLSKMNHHCNNNNDFQILYIVICVCICMVEEHTLRQFLLATRHTASHTLLLNEMLHVSLLLFILTLCSVVLPAVYVL